MPYSIILTEEAILDIDQAVKYYNGISFSPGFEFVDLNFKKIAALPTASAVRYDNIRVKALYVFPFTIHLIIASDSTVTILRVFQHDQKPLTQ